jgi:outer membrane protein OmpA-like peptidoglycan-associated protein
MKRMVVAMAGASMLASCATDPRTGQPSLQETFASDDPCSNNARNVGIAVGAIAGAIIGNQVKHSNGARLLGAAIGATAGGLIGRDMDRRRCELARVARQYELDMTVATVATDGTVEAPTTPAQAVGSKDAGVGMVVQLRDRQGDEAQFESNSDQLTPRAQSYFTAIADSYNSRKTASHIQDASERARYVAHIASRKILLVGHTDDTGNSRLNADLSERRAKAVSAFMEKQGIPRESLYFQGAGEAYPIADNATEVGRARNRRVEIVEVADASTLDRFLAARKPRYEYYRVQEAAAASPAPAATAKSAGPLQTPPPSRIAQRKVPAATGISKGVEAPAPSGKAIDFGGVPLSKAIALASIGTLEKDKSYFSFISTAHAAAPAELADCTRDRPRVANGVKSLASGKTHRTSEFLPGLYGKTWTDQVNAHQVVLNKVAVLAGDGSLANLPEFKVYANYNPARDSNPAPDVSLSPEVNTYLGERGLLYRIFLDGRNGLSCVDIVFNNDGAPVAKAGRIVYERGATPYAADFTPRIYQK